MLAFRSFAILQVQLKLSQYETPVIAFNNLFQLGNLQICHRIHTKYVYWHMGSAVGRQLVCLILQGRFVSILPEMNETNNRNIHV